MIGETLRKLTFKVTLRADMAQIGERLMPYQMAVAVKSGVEVVVHSARRWLRTARHDPLAVLLQRDVRNAFNTADPSQFLADCREHAPASARFAEYCYGGNTALVYNGRVESSSRGQQGCPIMAPLFCLMRARMAQEAQALAGVRCDFCPEYADDSYCGGDCDAVLSMFKHEVALGKKYGVEFDLAKCRLHVPSGAAFQGDLAEFRRMGVCIVYGDDVEILKAPVSGSEEFLDSFCSKKAQELDQVFDAVGKLSHKHVALHLLRHCLTATKVQYLARTAPSPMIRSLLVHYDGAVRNTLEDILETKLSEVQRRQAQLSTSKGGLGLRSAVAVADAAYVASCRASWRPLLPQTVRSNRRWPDC